MQLTLIDSPVANTANIARALRAAGADVRLSRDASAIAAADKLVLPGVGSFGAAMHWLREEGIDDAIRTAVRRKVLLLGICVGHQLLFERSEEMGSTDGLGLVRGIVDRLDGVLSVPQIGWNRVAARGGLFDGIPDGTSFYFVNSYAVRSAEQAIGEAHYNGPFTAAVQSGRVFGVQFHPEKSSAAGLRILRNFVSWT